MRGGAFYDPPSVASVPLLPTALHMAPKIPTDALASNLISTGLPLDAAPDCRKVLRNRYFRARNFFRAACELGALPSAGERCRNRPLLTSPAAEKSPE